MSEEREAKLDRPWVTKGWVEVKDESIKAGMGKVEGAFGIEDTGGWPPLSLEDVLGAPVVWVGARAELFTSRSLSMP